MTRDELLSLIRATRGFDSTRWVYEEEGRGYGRIIAITVDIDDPTEIGNGLDEAVARGIVDSLNAAPKLAAELRRLLELEL